MWARVALGAWVLASVSLTAIADPMSSQRDAALVAESRHLARAAHELSLTGDNGSALALALEALPADLRNQDRPFDAVAEGALLETVWNMRERAVLRGHDKQIHHLSYSPDGKHVATASADSTVRIWQAESGREVAVLKHAKPVFRTTFALNGSRLVTLSYDGLRIWDVATMSELPPLAGLPRDLGNNLSFSADGSRLLLTLFPGMPRVFDIKTGATVVILPAYGQVTTAVLSPAGERALIVTQDGTAQLWSVATATVVATLGEFVATGPARTAFSPDGSHLATVSRENIVRIWNAATGQPVSTLRGHTGSIGSVTFAPDGARVLTASADGTARLWHPSNGSIDAVLPNHEDGVVAAIYSADGTRVMTRTADRVRVWDAAEHHELFVLAGHEGRIRHAAFSPDRTSIATASDDGTARLWDASGGEVFLEARPRPVFGWSNSRAVLSRDGSRIARSAHDGTVQVWDVSTGGQLAALRVSKGAVQGLAFSPDNDHVLASSRDDGIGIWQVSIGRRVMLLAENGERSATYSPDGVRIATGAEDGTVRIRESATGLELLATPASDDGVPRSIFAPNGTRLATWSSRGPVRLWDAASGREISVYAGNDAEPTCIAFSPDGSRIVIGTNVGSIRIWDVASGHKLLDLRVPKVSWVFNIS